MPSGKHYKKLFYDREMAVRFGQEVEQLAEAVQVPIGKKEKPGPVISHDRGYDKDVGYYHEIQQDVGSQNRPIYYVHYHIDTPRNARKADALQAQRQIEAFLDEKYTELGPDPGRSLP